MPITQVEIPDLILRVSQLHPDMTISTKLKKPNVLLNGLAKGTYQLIILPLPTNRVSVPITDPEVNVTYYLVCKKESRKRFSALFT